MAQELDLIYVHEKSLLKTAARMFKGRKFDAICMPHPSGVGSLYTVVNYLDNTAFVITSRELARRYQVVKAEAAQLKTQDDVPKAVLGVHIVDKVKYLEEGVQVHER